MCEGSASITVDRNVVEGACGGREMLPVGLLTRPRLDCGWSCERVTGFLVFPWGSGQKTRAWALDLVWDHEEEWRRGARRSRKVETKRQEMKSGWDRQPGRSKQMLVRRCCLGCQGCLFGRVPVTWRIYILLRSDSEGIQMWPGTEDWGVGNTSG